MKFLVGLLGVLFCMGCKEIPIESGVIPESYRNEAKLLEGRYDGEIFLLYHHRPNRTKGTRGTQRGLFEFKMDDQNRLIAVSDMDFAGRKCESSLGHLIRMVIDEKEKIVGLEFSLDPGKCAEDVSGRSVKFKVSENKDSAMVDLDRKSSGQYREWIRGHIFR